MLNIVALIPARSKSKRVPDKNIKTLAGHPLIAYTIAAALQSEVFSDVFVSTDSEDYAEIASYYGANIPFLRPPNFALDSSPDIEWLTHTLSRFNEDGKLFDCFSILRPTSPFRQPETIKRAWKQFRNESQIDSLRAVEKCAQHPAKMWYVRNSRMTPVLEGTNAGIPWHSSQYNTLPDVFVQNASLEIAWARVVLKDRSIAGKIIAPFFTEGYEGVDINQPYDWHYAEYLINNKLALLPDITSTPFSY